MSMPPTVLPGAELPAWSLAGSLVTLWSTPSPLISLLVGQEATPERASAQVKSTTTSPWYQPSPLGRVVGAPSTVGGVAAFANGAPGFRPAGQAAGTQRTVSGNGAPPTVKFE